MPPRHILAFDTALSSCAAAVLDTKTGAAVAEVAPMVRGHAEILLPMIGRVLDRASAGYADIDLIAVTVGPGAFTGLRIGLAAARAMALALNKPVAGITTLSVLARQYKSPPQKGEGWVGCYDAQQSGAVPPPQPLPSGEGL